MRYLPTYSPDLNPIEQAFSKLKMALRRVAARHCEGASQARRKARQDNLHQLSVPTIFDMPNTGLTPYGQNIGLSATHSCRLLMVIAQEPT